VKRSDKPLVSIQNPPKHIKISYSPTLPTTVRPRFKKRITQIVWETELVSLLLVEVRKPWV